MRWDSEAVPFWRLHHLGMATHIPGQLDLWLLGRWVGLKLHLLILALHSPETVFYPGAAGEVPAILVLLLTVGT